MANMAQAIRMALHYGETHLGVTDIFGQDVGMPLGGVFTQTQGLKKSWNSPLDERGIIGMAMGLAMAGERPVAEIQFADYIYNTIDQLKLAGNACWSTNGDWNLPMVVMTPVGAGIRGSIYHSHSFDAIMTHIPGWKILLPSNPLEAYGLLLSAMQEENPVMFLPPKALMRVRGEELIPGEPEDPRELAKMIDAPLGDRSKWKAKWPKLEPYMVPIGKGRIVREGSQLTVVSYGRMLLHCADAAKTLAEEGIDAEVIDLRTLWPYDWEMIKASVEKTGRVLFVNEDMEVTNFGEHLLRRTVEELFYKLLAPPRLIAGKFLPGIGLHDNLERASVPQLEEITAGMRELALQDP